MEEQDTNLEIKTSWFIHTPDDFTNGVIVEIKRNQGKHDTDIFPNKFIPSENIHLNLWKVSYLDIQMMLQNKKRKNLKFLIYRESTNQAIHRWEMPIKGDELKIILPLIPMSKNIEEYERDYKEVMDISYKHSSPHVMYVPVWVILSMIGKDKDNHDYIRRGFKTIFTFMLRGAFNEVHLHGKKITSGVEKIVLVAKVLNIPVIAKTEGTKRDLAKLLNS